MNIFVGKFCVAIFLCNSYIKIILGTILWNKNGPLIYPSFSNFAVVDEGECLLLLSGSGIEHTKNIHLNFRRMWGGGCELLFPHAIYLHVLCNICVILNILMEVFISDSYNMFKSIIKPRFNNWNSRFWLSMNQPILSKYTCESVRRACNLNKSKMVYFF